MPGRCGGRGRHPCDLTRGPWGGAGGDPPHLLGLAGTWSASSLMAPSCLQPLPPLPSSLLPHSHIPPSSHAGALAP